MLKQKWYCTFDQKRKEWCAESILSFFNTPLILRKAKGPYNTLEEAFTECARLSSR